MYQKLFVSFALVFLALLIAACSDSSSHSDEAQTSPQGNAFERDYSPSLGPVSAKVTIVEFFDPACEACRAFYPFVKEIMARHPDDVRVVLRYATFHDGSETVVRMLEAARLQNVFIPVLEGLLKAQPEWASHHSPNLDRAWDIAQSSGLNLEAAKAVMNTQAFDQILAQEKEDIRQLKVSQTPTFFVNNKPLTTFGGQELYDLVVSEL
jgi:protein-disulfide isomerase